MMKNDLINVFESVFDVTTVTAGFSKSTCAEWDSIKHLMLVVEIESKFEIVLGPDEINKIDSFVSAYEVVKKHKPLLAYD
jgi:acyl carrier protein